MRAWLGRKNFPCQGRKKFSIAARGGRRGRGGDDNIPGFVYIRKKGERERKNYLF